MVLLPLAEATLRKFLQTGISGATSLEQHLTLIVGMLGGALAARDNRLLSLSTLGGQLPPAWRRAGSILSAAVAAAVTGYLCVAGYQFVVIESDSGHTLVYGLPLWMVQALIPLGFALIMARIVGYSAETWKGRAITTALTAAMMLLCMKFSLSMAALILLGAASLFGVPAFVTMGGLALILFWRVGEPIGSVPIDHYSLVTNPTLPTMPLFTLAGYFLAEGGAPKRMIRVFGAVFGSLRGGAALVTAVACAFFTSFTGGSGVTILALGGLLMPVLLAQRYSERDALGLITGAGSLGLLFPPCLPLILYAIVANVEIKAMFLGGLLPGTVMLIATAAWGVFIQKPAALGSRSFDWKEAGAALWEAKWELLLPVVALVTLFGGFATPVEAAAATAFYAFLIETVFYRDLNLSKDIPRVMSECGLLIGGVLLILGVALGFTNYLITSEVTTRAAEWTTSTIKSPLVFLLVLNFFLLIVGCLMDIYSAIVVQVPILAPIGKAFGIDPIHLGIVFLANLELGYLTPPVGLNLFLSSYRFNKPLPEVIRSVGPIVLVLGIGVLVITYVPWLTTALPRWLR
jgi:tripartite ATP-independent transporter DctM subunit